MAIDEQSPQRNDIIRKLLTRLEAHNSGERRHAERVAIYAVAVGEKLGLTEVELVTLRYSAQLHDIGKLRLPETLLNRGEALRAEERVLVERHPELARSELEAYPWLQTAIPAIVSHHERWDGTGYPLLLKGTAIPLGGRIVGACEAFDVNANGLYQSARGRDLARDMIHRESGKAFDPQVVEALLEVCLLINPVD